MNPPTELQQLDTLNSVAVNPFWDALIKAIYAEATDQSWRETLQNFWLLLPEYAVGIMLNLFAFSLVLSLILIFIIIWTSNRIMSTRKKMIEAVNPSGVALNNDTDAVINKKWENVIRHINSPNQADWKLAILECDIMLGELLDKLGYMQDSIGEKLKAVEPGNFKTIDSAWEAHKIRNAIAHDGSDFLINEREAKRVIGLYEAVFLEFSFI